MNGVDTSITSGSSFTGGVTRDADVGTDREVLLE
jgi:hypothetical protein